MNIYGIGIDIVDINRNAISRKIRKTVMLKGSQQKKLFQRPLEQELLMELILVKL